MLEVVIRGIVLLIIVAVSVAAFRTKELDCVKNSIYRIMFRLSYATMVASGLSFLALWVLDRIYGGIR
jgi:hypothetical protein